MNEGDTSGDGNTGGTPGRCPPAGSSEAPRHEVRRARPMKIRIRRLAVAAVATYLGVCVLLHFLQAKLIYYPTREYASTPEDIGMEFADLTLRAADGVGIAAWYVPHPNPTGSVIFCHGNRCLLNWPILEVSLSKTASS